MTEDNPQTRLIDAFHERTGRCMGEPHLDCARIEQRHREGNHIECLPVEDGASEPAVLGHFVGMDEAERRMPEPLRNPDGSPYNPEPHLSQAEHDRIRANYFAPGAILIEPCGYGIAWHKPCAKPGSEPDGRCEQHADRPCASCKEPAERECSYAGSIAVCGANLCERCEHSPAGFGHSRIGRSEQPSAQKQADDQSREALLDVLDFDGTRAQVRAEAKGFDVTSRTSVEGRTVQVVMTSNFTQLLTHTLDAMLARPEWRGSPGGLRLLAFASDLRKVNP